MSGRGTVSISAEQVGQMLHIDWIEHHTKAGQNRKRASSGQGEGIMHAMMIAIGGSLATEMLDNGYCARLTMRMPVI